MRLSVLLSAMGMLFLVGCSSAPKTTDQLSMDSRSQYVTDVRDNLTKWDKRASDLKGDSAADLKASIADTRAELGAMEAAPADSWQGYRDRINSRLDHIQNVYDHARAE